MQHERALELAKGGMKPVDIAAELGVSVNIIPFKSVKGVAMSLGANKLILIDSGLTEIEQQLVCGHELGHFLFHKEENFLFILEKTFFYPKHEYQANLFGCQLLLGEKAEVYETEIKEAANCRSLTEMAQIIYKFTCDEGEGI